MQWLRQLEIKRLIFSIGRGKVFRALSISLVLIWNLNLFLAFPIFSGVNSPRKRIVIFQTKRPVNDWLHYRLVGPASLLVENSNRYTLIITPADYQKRPHRFKWVAESWIVGDPDIDVALLLPDGVGLDPKDVTFDILSVHHGTNKPGQSDCVTTPKMSSRAPQGRSDLNLRTKDIDCQRVEIASFPSLRSGPRNDIKTSKISIATQPEWVEAAGSGPKSPWSSQIIGQLISSALNFTLNMAVSVASFTEAIGDEGRQREALESFSGEAYYKFPISLPMPPADFCAVKINFNLDINPRKLKSSSQNAGIIFKAEKRTPLGQYKSEYFILEFPLNIEKEVTDNTVILFQEDFSAGLEKKWIAFGSPKGRIANSFGNPPPGFDNNGDGMYNSGAISKKRFNFQGGLVIECDMYVPEKPAGCWIGGTFGLAKNPEQFGDDKWPGEVVKMDYGYSGKLCWQDEDPKDERVLTCAIITDNGNTERFRKKQFNNYLDGWHNFHIVIKNDKRVDFFIDDRLIYSTRGCIARKYNFLPIVLGSRSSEYGKTYHDNLNISSPENKLSPNYSN